MDDSPRNSLVRTTHKRLRSRIALVTVFMLIAAACGDGGGTTETTESEVTTTTEDSTTTTSDSSSTTEAPSEDQGTPGEAPASVEQFYEGSELFVELHTNPYDGWTPPEAPWTFCMSESFTGNAWRQGHLAGWTELVADLVEEGLATDELRITDSGGDVALQVSQMNTLANAGCSVIVIMPGSPDALCGEIDKASEQGILVITSDSPVNCEGNINVTYNGYYNAQLGADSVVQALGGSGSIVALAGIQGALGAAVQEAAYTSVFEANPDVELAGKVVGNWTPGVAQSETAKFLTTYQDPVDGIFEMGEMGVAAQRALRQAGREPAVMYSGAGECAVFAFWKENPDSVSLAVARAPHSSAYTTFHVAMRMLSGQQPILNTMIYPVPIVDESNFDEFYDPSYTEESTCYPSRPDGRSVDDSYFDVFFSGGEPVDTTPPDVEGS